MLKEIFKFFCISSTLFSKPLVLKSNKVVCRTTLTSISVTNYIFVKDDEHCIRTANFVRSLNEGAA